MSDLPHRCEAMCRVTPTLYKRCVRARDHAESEMHLWVEALNRSDGHPELIEWLEDVAEIPQHRRFMVDAAFLMADRSSSGE